MAEARTRSREDGTLDREERLRQLGRVTGELLHDLGGLLSILAGRVSLAREEAALGRTPSEELSRIQSDTEEIRRMVVEVLDELRGFRTPMELTFPVEGTLEEVVNRWLMGAPAVTTTLNSSLRKDVQVSGPRSFFSRAIRNLLRNAARHARSEIRLSVRLTADGEQVEIRVEDDGDGVSRELADRLFDPFVSGTGLGVGLGLSFARWGIERLGGGLTFEPDPSILDGATFRVVLPLSTMARRYGSPGGPGNRAPIRDRSPLAGLCVTIVDDDSAVRRTFGLLLRRSGAEALEMDPVGWSSVAQAVGSIRTETPDVVLLDLNLRDLSAKDIYRSLRAEAPELADRVVFFTGGAVPQQGVDRPVVSKMLAWDDFILCVLQAVRPEG